MYKNERWNAYEDISVKVEKKKTYNAALVNYLRFFLMK